MSPPVDACDVLMELKKRRGKLKLYFSHPPQKTKIRWKEEEGRKPPVSNE